MNTSLWGEVQEKKKILPGIYWITTAGHGGLKVSGQAKELLSKKAQYLGTNHGGSLYYEEDCQYVIPFVDNRKIYDAAIKVLGEFSMESLETSMKTYYPEYFNPLFEEKANKAMTAIELLPNDEIRFDKLKIKSAIVVSKKSNIIYTIKDGIKLYRMSTSYFAKGYIQAVYRNGELIWNIEQ